MPKTKAEQPWWWKNRDKAAHFLGCLACTWAMAAGLHKLLPEAPLWSCRASGAMLAMAFGVGKEVFDARKDSQGKPLGTGWSWPDLAADALGILVGLLLPL